MHETEATKVWLTRRYSNCRMALIFSWTLCSVHINSTFRFEKITETWLQSQSSDPKPLNPVSMKDFFTYIYLDFPRAQFSAEGIFLDRGIPGHHRGSNWDQASLENNFREPVSPRRGKTLQYNCRDEKNKNIFPSVFLVLIHELKKVHLSNTLRKHNTVVFKYRAYEDSI